MRHVRELVVLTGVLALAVAVLAPAATAATTTNRYGIHDYVAIGDSYSAGYGIPYTAFAGGCYRSTHSYPVIMAEVLRSDTFHDVTCSGATPSDVTQVQARTAAPAQFGALSADTDLVTIGLGANQGGLFGGLVLGCAYVRRYAPRGHPCETLARRSGNDAFYALADQAGDAIRTVLDSVHMESPHAQVVVVGYPRLAPDTGTCAQLPLATGDYPYVNSVIKRLDDDLQTAARDAGAAFVDMWTPSKGHDICARSPWVQGSKDSNGLAGRYHPFYAEQRAVALRIDAVVRAAAAAS